MIYKFILLKLINLFKYDLLRVKMRVPINNIVRISTHSKLPVMEAIVRVAAIVQTKFVYGYLCGCCPDYNYSPDFTSTTIF